MVRGREISMVRDPSRRAVRFFGVTCLALPTTLPLAGVAGAGPDGILLWTVEAPGHSDGDQAWQSSSTTRLGN
jgi:hypothetical protein